MPFPHRKQPRSYYLVLPELTQNPSRVGGQWGELALSVELPVQVPWEVPNSQGNQWGLCYFSLYIFAVQNKYPNRCFKTWFGGTGWAQQARVGISAQIPSTLQQVLVEDFKSYCLKVETSRSWLLAGNSLWSVGTWCFVVVSSWGIGKFVNS